MDFIELCKERYSCRDFADRPIASEVLAQILEAGRLSPTAKNCQPQRVIVVQSPEARLRLRKATPMVRNAPLTLAVGYSKAEVSVLTMDSAYPGGYSTGTQDASIVATSMMYEAAELGVGSLWIRGYDTTKVRAALDLDDDVELVMLLSLGYPAEGAAPSPGHESRRPLGDTVMYL